MQVLKKVENKRKIFRTAVIREKALIISRMLSIFLQKENDYIMIL
ncbi:MAG: hypothetical protein JSC085_000227 [Candidatus Tokpelaia sp. JSC085]|nr:MAG: hypothetical protein JSC085_000227 [Candidatus Tokpelaia sp. JSC085]